MTEDEARREADFVYHIIKRYNVQLPVIIDFEFPEDDEGNAVGRLADAATDKKTNTVNAFIEEMQSKGYISGVYASSSVLKNNLDIKGLPRDSFVWAADYNGKVGYDIDYTVWQYSKTGECDGVESRYVDLNYWYGS